MDKKNTNFKNDECLYNSHKNNNLKTFEYSIYNGKYENAKQNCNKSCCQNNANINNNWSTIGVRTDIESYLKLVNVNSNKCLDSKKLNSEKIFGNNFNNIKPVVVNPKLCERSL